MRKTHALAVAFAIAAAFLAAKPEPSNAGSRHGHRHHHRHHHFHERYGGVDFYVYQPRSFGEPVFGWKAHVRWCRSRHYGYVPARNVYVDSWGRWRRCDSPFD
jgi:hypothetical protein